MKQFIRSILFLLISAYLMQGAGAQFFFTGPGFLPDENGTNLDAPQGGKASQNLAAVAVLKDCAECPEMVVIPAGSFVMGSDKNNDEKPPHTVTIRSHAIGKTEVTQQQWANVMGSNPSFFKDCGSECPVESINVDGIQSFINRLNQKKSERSTGYQAKPNGSMRLGQALPPNGLLATMSQSFLVTGGTRETVVVRRMRSGRSYQMRLVYLICMAMFGNLPKTVGIVITLVHQRMALHGKAIVWIGFGVAALGVAAQRACGRPFAVMGDDIALGMLLLASA